MMHDIKDSMKQEVANLKQTILSQQDEILRLRTLSSVFETSGQPVALVNAHFQILNVNPAFSALTKYSEDDLHLFPINAMLAHHKRTELWPPLQRDLEEKGHWKGLLWNETKTGETYQVDCHVQNLNSTSLDTAQYAFFFHDVTIAKETEEKLHHQSNYDLVTDLPNWKLFLNRFINSLYTSGQEGSRTALLFIGLDGFKTINDTLGYTIGDKLLQETAIRFARILPPSVTVARFSADQFTAVISGIQDDEEVRQIAQTVLQSLERAFDIEDEEIYISCSIGVCIWPGDGDDVETLLRNADSAMHKAKASGRNTFHFFTPDIDAKAQAQRRIERDLRHAIKTMDEFHLVYQPIVDLKTGEMKSAEALIRWHSPERGLVSPDHFIPLAEQSDLILPIGEWVLERACHEIQDWSTKSKVPFRVSINLSSRQFRNQDLPHLVKKTLENTGFNPHQLSLEITETLMMENIEEALAMLHELKAMGVRLSIDDFGTGYSSLNYLKRFPIDTLKIDRSFVRDVTENPEDAAMVNAIITMAQSLGLEIIGEGIETEDQKFFLRERGCDRGQGYYFSRPLRIEEFNQFAMKQNDPPTS